MTGGRNAADEMLVSDAGVECLDIIASLIDSAAEVNAPLEMRDLSLTLACIERTLYQYTADVLLTSPDGRSLVSFNVALTLRDALAVAAERLDELQPSFLWGGVASLLYNTHGALVDTAACMRGITRYAYATAEDAALSVCGIFAAGLVARRLGLAERLVAAASGTRASQGIMRYADYALRPLRDTLPMRAAVRVTWWTLRAWGLYMTVRLFARGMRYLRMRKLRRCHRQLSLLLRMWQIVLESIAEGRQRNRRRASAARADAPVEPPPPPTAAAAAAGRSGGPQPPLLTAMATYHSRSYASLIAVPAPADYYESAKNATRRLLERVALPTVPYLHTWEQGRMGWLKYALDVLLATTGVAFRAASSLPGLSQRQTELVALPMLLPALPYFAAHPAKASNYAAGIRSRMTIALARFCAGFLHNPPLRYLLIAAMSVPRERGWRASFNFVREHGFSLPSLRARGLALNERLSVMGTPLFVFSARPLRTPLGAGALRPALVPPLPSRLRHFLTMYCGVDLDSAGAADAEKPASASPAAGAPDGGEVPPVVFFIHGGGFIMSLLDMDFLFLGRMLRASGAVAVVPEYSLAPEHPYPFALNQCEATYRWVLAGGLGFVPRRIVFAGESAGANLAAALCIRLIMSNRDLNVHTSDSNVYDTDDEADDSMVDASDAPLTPDVLSVADASYDKDDYDSAASGDAEEADDVGEDADDEHDSHHDLRSKAAATPGQANDAAPGSRPRRKPGARRRRRLRNKFGNRQVLLDGRVRSVCVPLPHAVVIAYPAVNVALSPSPSRALHMADPLIAYGVMMECVHGYMKPVAPVADLLGGGGTDASPGVAGAGASPVPGGIARGGSDNADAATATSPGAAAGPLARPRRDRFTYHHHTAPLHKSVCNPQISPVFASLSLLREMPPCALLVGGHDPLLDDAVDFFVLLRRAGVSAKIKIFRSLPHGFLSLDLLLPEADVACALACRWITHFCHADANALASPPQPARRLDAERSTQQHDASASGHQRRGSSGVVIGPPDDDLDDDMTDGDADVSQRLAIGV